MKLFGAVFNNIWRVIVKVLLCSCPFFLQSNCFGAEISLLSWLRFQRFGLVDPFSRGLLTRWSSLPQQQAWMVCLFSLFRLLFSRTAFCSVWLIGKVLLRLCLIFFSLQLFWGQIFLCCLDFIFSEVQCGRLVLEWQQRMRQRTFLLSACLIWRYRWYLVF